MNKNLTDDGYKASEHVSFSAISGSIPLVSPKSNVTWKLAQGLAIFFGLTYFVMLVDVLMEHHLGLAPVSALQLVPIVFSPLAAVAALALGLWPRRPTLYAFATIMGLSVLVGLAGMYFHLGSDLVDVTVNSFHALPPKLAPLAFSGLGAMGLLVTFGFFKPTWLGKDLLFDPMCGRYFPRDGVEAVVRIDGECYGLCCPMCQEEFSRRGGLAKPAA